MDYWGGGGVQSVRQTRASGGMFPWEILILDLLLDTISWNLGLFSHTHNYLLYWVIKAFIKAWIDLHVNRMPPSERNPAWFDKAIFKLLW